MMRISTLVLLLFTAGCGASPPEQEFATAVARALGGAEAIRGIGVFVVEGRGSAGNLGQDMTWEAESQRFDLTNVRRAYDLSAPRTRTVQTRTPAFVYFQGPQPQQQVSGVDGEIAYTIAANGRATRQSAAVARERSADYYHHPLTLARALLNPTARVANVRVENGTETADVTIGDVTFAVTLDASGQPTRVTSPSYHANMGDVTIATTFSQYQPTGGLALPMRLATGVDGRFTTEWQVDRYVFDAPPADIAAPPAAASMPAPTASSPTVQVITVAPGVWLLGGQSHHSALIEFADHLTLIEAPQSAARTSAVIAAARATVPTKPLTELVMSHHHFDHSAGLRVAVSEGLAVITHKANAGFVEEMLRRAHSQQPDALQRGPKPLTLRTVDGELTLKDTAMTMTLYALPGNPHGDTMLMAYVPGSRVLIQADAFSPGGTYHPYAANLLESIRLRALRVDRIVPLHGTVVSFDELVKAVAAEEPGPR